MEIEETDVEFALVAIQFGQQKIGDEQTAHQQEGVNRNCGI